MQLSWIDPEALRDLAAKLQDPVPSDSRKSQSEPFHSFAASKAIEADIFGFRLSTEAVEVPLPQSQPVAPPVVQPVTAAVVAPVAVTAPPPPVAEPEIPFATPHPNDEQVARIREQLQSIRAKAVEAGLLQPEPAPVVPPPAPAPPAPELVAAPVELAPLPQGPMLGGVPSVPSLSENHALASEAPAPSAPAPTQEPPRHFLPLEGDLGHRLESYGQWASHRVISEEMLIVDDHGEVLWGTATRSDLAFSALLSLNAAMRSSADGVCRPPMVVRNQLSPTRQLTIVPCSTRHGTVTLAMLNARPVPDSTLELLRDALVAAVEGR